MTAVVILLILASLAATFMIYGMGRARMNNAVFDAAALYSGAQLSAMSRGTPHYALVRRAPDGTLRLHVLERPDAPPAIDWSALDLAAGPEAALAFDEPQDNGDPPIPRNAFNRGSLVLGASSGPDSGGLAFIDLDSARVPRPLPAPFSALPVTTPLFDPPDRELPTPELMAGCSFCINPPEPYGVIRFNPNGTVEMMTGEPTTGGVIAFMPGNAAEAAIPPRILSIAAPSGAVHVF
jgi:hypothetical protein